MDYYLSTIADVDYGQEENEQISYIHHTAPVARQYGLGLELAEFCISENLDGGQKKVLAFFEENAAAADELLLHAPYNEILPQAIDPKVVQVAWDRMTWSYELCRRFHVKKMVVHANYVSTLYYPQWFIARHVEFWKRFVRENDGDTVICIENVTEQEPRLITEIIRQVDDPRVRMCLDVGHANLTPIAPMAWLEACAPFLSHLHIHNNNGPVSEGLPGLGDTHRGLADGVIDMETLLRRADTLAPGLTASVESCDIEKSCLWLKEKGLIG